MNDMYDQSTTPVGASALPGSPSPAIWREPSGLDRFLARAAERRAQQEAHPERFSGVWVDPDPRAATRLPESRHPITVLLDEAKQSRHHIAHRRLSIRHVLGALTHQPRENLSWDDITAYPWHQITPDMARQFRREICRKYPNRNSQQAFIQTLRSILCRCRRANLMSAEALHQVLEQLPTKNSRSAAQKARCLTGEDLNALMAASAQDKPFLAARDAAMFALMSTTGMRVSEVVGVDLADWDRRKDTLTLRDTKNGRDRVVPVDDRVAAYFKAWLAHRGGIPGPLFTPDPIRKRPTGRLRTHTVHVRLKTLARRAGIGHVQTHDFRRTVATSLLRKHDAAIVAKLLGHSSLAATLTYDLSGQDEQRWAISTLPLPECAVEPELEGEPEDGHG